MRDVSNKTSTLRTATAQAIVTMDPETVQRVISGNLPKGSPFEVAKVAGIMAAKSASSIVPYCHPVPIDFVGVEFETGVDSITITTVVKAIYKTGVEMEALTAASVAALTIYDMLKIVDNHLIIREVRLLDKSGGKSDFVDEWPFRITAGVLVMSDSISAGRKSDCSGQMIVARLKTEDIELAEMRVIPDDPTVISATVREWCDVRRFDLIITSGGTGFSPRDCTPEAMQEVFERQIPGIAEALRAYGQDRTPYSMFSRSTAGIRGQSIIVNLPGSTRGVQESLDVLFPAIKHAFRMLRGEGHVSHHQPHKESNA